MSPTTPFDEVLGNLSKVRILRHLAAGYREETGRRLAKVAQVSQPAILRPLQELVEQGILEKKVRGRSHVFTLNRRNLLVEKGVLPLFDLEGNLFQELGKLLRTTFGETNIDSALIYGSVARGEATQGSDWDILLLCSNPKKVQEIDKTLPKYLIEWSLLFSTPLDIKTMTTAEYKKKFKSDDKLAKKIYDDFLVSRIPNPLFGKSLTEILGSR
ncbi:MAG: nucleotidyltransferase domain-containing protein [Deltaproteobacteria bacterium]|nr:nucleotidyltransferase domain-containing protein [Deltaproteobacteria bacterium]MBI2501377.1 nucleotidyltransferase domain-containing protein [Deltaproteobacteria bacterium]